MHTHRSLVWLVLVSTLVLCAFWLLTLPLSAAESEKPSTFPDLVISQIYGGGGNSAALYKNDFIELFNRGPDPVDLSDWSVQYASAAGSTWSVTILTGTIPGGRYYLIQEAKGAGGSEDLPAADSIGSIAMSASNGKVALLNNQGRIATGTVCPSGPGIVDFVGYGTANCAEGTPAPKLNNTIAALRDEGGCTDSDDNASDFAVGAPDPRNISSAPHACGPIDSSTNTATATPTLAGPDTPTNTPTFTPTSTTTATPTPTSTNVLPHARIYVNEFLPQPKGDWNGDGEANTDDEWLELFNAGNSPVDLGGYRLDDAAGGGSIPYTIPAGALIPARGFLVFFHFETKIALNDTGDDVRLLYADGATADSISYSSAKPDRSFSRYPDGAAFFTSDCAPSPYAINCSVAPTLTPTPPPYPQGILVNEFMPQPHADWNHDGSRDSWDEWIEITNSSPESVDLAGWKLDDGEGGSSPFSIPVGTTISPKEFLVFYADQTNIGLNDDGDEVRLLHPDSTVADDKGYNSSDPDRAYGRKPDGGVPWQTRCYPTPGQPNCSVVITPTPTAIYHLTDFSKARTLPSGSQITMLGSVIARPCQLDQYGHEMMLSDDTAGIDVYLPYPEQLTCAIAIGEQVLVTGVITDHYGLRELRLESNREVERNYATPREIAPCAIHTNDLDDEYESALVTVQGKVVNGKNGDTIWVDDGDGAVQVEATASSGVSFEGITHGSVVSVTGVGYHYNRYTGQDEGYTLRPRMPEDVTVIKLAAQVPPAPSGRGKDLGAVSIETAHTTHTGNYVLMGGIVTVPPGVIGSRDFWIQDASGGVHVYAASSSGEAPLLHLWENVTVRGRVTTYYGEREVRVEDPDSIDVFGVGTEIAPLRLQTGALTLKEEGELAEIAGAVTRSRGRDIYLDDGSGETLVYVDPDSRIGLPHLNVGDALRVVGVVRRFQKAPEIVPRFEGNLIYEEALGANGTTKDAKEGTKAAKESTNERSSPTLTARPSATRTLTKRLNASATPTVQLAAEVIRRPMPGGTTRISQAGLSISDDWGLTIGAAALMLLCISAVTAFGVVWKRRQRAQRGRVANRAPLLRTRQQECSFAISCFPAHPLCIQQRLGCDISRCAVKRGDFECGQFE